jgi:Flp pilus assembly protein TadG
MRHRQDDQRGQTLVEFALILPIFVLVLVGIFDVGRAIYAYNTVNNAAREAVRVAIVDQDTAAITAEAVSQSVSLGLNSSAVTVDFLQPDYTDNAPCNVSPRYGCVASVEVAYTYNAATPIISQLMGTLTLTGASMQPIERTNP